MSYLLRIQYICVHKVCEPEQLDNFEGQIRIHQFRGGFSQWKMPLSVLTTREHSVV